MGPLTAYKFHDEVPVVNEWQCTVKGTIHELQMRQWHSSDEGTAGDGNGIHSRPANKTRRDEITAIDGNGNHSRTANETTP